MKRGFLLLAMASSLQAQDFFDTIEVDTNTTEQISTISTRAFILNKWKYGLNTPDDRYAFERNNKGLSQWQTDGFVELKLKQNATWRYQLSAKIEVDWWQWHNGEGEFTINHERLLLKDAFVDGHFDSGTWLRFGHQVFAWGESEGLTVSDVLSPSDLREFGQAELRDLREPVPALLLSQQIGQAYLSLIATYDAGLNRYADANEEYYSLIAVKDTNTTIRHNKPDNLSEWALRFEYSVNGSDLSLVAADINSNEYTLQQSDQGLMLSQNRVSVLAASFNRAHGNILWRGELGHYWNQHVFQADGLSIKDNQLRLAAGFDYNGWHDWKLTYELNTLVAQHAQTHHNPDFGHVLNLSHSAINEKLQQQLWLQSLVQDNGRVLRYDISYNYNDHWQYGLKLVLYENSVPRSQLFPFRQHDTINFSVNYNF